MMIDTDVFDSMDGGGAREIDGFFVAADPLVLASVWVIFLTMMSATRIASGSGEA